MILQGTQSVKWSLNIRYSESSLKDLKTSRRYFSFAALFNSFFVMQSFKSLKHLLESALGLDDGNDDDDDDDDGAP